MVARSKINFSYGWHAVPNAFGNAIETHKISLKAQAVFDYLCATRDEENKSGKSCAEIAASRNMSLISAKRAMKELRTLGWITSEPRYNRFENKVGNWYYINELPPSTIIAHSDEPKKKQVLQEILDIQTSMPYKELVTMLKLLKAAANKAIQEAIPQVQPVSEQKPEAIPQVQPVVEQKPEAIPQVQPVSEQKDEAYSANEYGKHKNVLLTAEEYKNLIYEYGYRRTEQYITLLSSYMASKNVTYENHYATLNLWIDRDIIRQTEQIKNTSHLGRIRNRFNNFTSSRKRNYDEIERMELEHLIKSTENKPPSDDETNNPKRE